MRKWLVLSLIFVKNDPENCKNNVGHPTNVGGRPQVTPNQITVFEADSVVHGIVVSQHVAGKFATAQTGIGFSATFAYRIAQLYHLLEVSA